MWCPVYRKANSREPSSSRLRARIICTQHNAIEVLQQMSAHMTLTVATTTAFYCPSACQPACLPEEEKFMTNGWFTLAIKQNSQTARRLNARRKQSPYGEHTPFEVEPISVFTFHAEKEKFVLGKHNKNYVVSCMLVLCWLKNPHPRSRQRGMLWSSRSNKISFMCYFISSVYCAFFKVKAGQA